MIGSLLHFGHSSVVVTTEMALFEIRRGYQRFTEIPIPRLWYSIEEWQHDAINATVYDVGCRNIPAGWNADQLFAQQWFETSNIALEPVEHLRLQSLRCTLAKLQDELNACLQSQQTLPAYRDSLFHCIRLLQNEYNELEMANKYGGKYSIHEPLSSVLVRSEDRLCPLFMNLSTGVMAVQGATIETCGGLFGFSFADLGLQPTEVYRFEMGQYVRVA
jgi:hypothetical protein